jgi:predicted nucleic acid-binding protein
MIRYLDTSALLKLYVAEPEAQRVRESVSTTAFACMHLIACLYGGSCGAGACGPHGPALR